MGANVSTGKKMSMPADVKASVKAALGAGAQGVVHLRKRSEMRLANPNAEELASGSPSPALHKSALQPDHFDDGVVIGDAARVQSPGGDQDIHLRPVPLQAPRFDPVDFRPPAEFSHLAAQQD